MPARPRASPPTTLYCARCPTCTRRTRGGAKRAEVLLHQAIELDPEYPEALGTLTDSITNRALNGWHESVTRGRDEAGVRG